MIYRVYSKDGDNEYDLAFCKSREIANKYVEYLENQDKESQKKFYSLRRAFTIYDISEIYEDEDILSLINKK